MSTWIDDKCRRTVHGSDQHCPACHRTFTSTAAGDLHRDGPWDDRACLSPLFVRRHDKDGNDLGPAFEYDPKRDAWRLTMTEADRARLDRLRERARIATDAPQITAEQGATGV